jgi:hypothetical protein
MIFAVQHNMRGGVKESIQGFPSVGSDLLLITFITAKTQRNTRTDRRVHLGIQTRDPTVTAGQPDRQVFITVDVCDGLDSRSSH